METRSKLIVSNPSVRMGKPVIAGTRIPVELILEKLAAGETIEQILDAHPRLTRETIQAALAFAAEALRADVVYTAIEASGVSLLTVNLRLFQQQVLCSFRLLHAANEYARQRPARLPYPIYHE